MRGLLELMFLFSAMALVGCDTGNGKVVATGKLSHNGKNLNWGRVRFFDVANKELGGSTIKSDGTFIATDLPIQELKVVVEIAAPKGITPTSKAPPGTPVIPAANARPEKVVDVPAKYKSPETTTATINVTKANQEFDIKLD
ncbi:MAG: hypothetical protein K2X38_22560 [Gemmataceae bacterium]|nr:hypothetical protein [Gemmataceae bacterium]